jgi:formylglycine-generating enzyme required for sulfatase activity
VALRNAYLNRLLEQTGFLSLSGIDPAVANEKDARLQLGAVYTALLTRSPREEIGQCETPEGEREPSPLSALEVLDRQARLVLLGDPGGGKSTFVNFVALCLAGEALGRPDVNVTLLTSSLPQDDERSSQEESTPQRWTHGTLLPVRIVLRDFAARGLPNPGKEAAARNLWQFLEAELEEAGISDFFPVLRRELLGGRGMVLLDGLDEVPEAEKRREQIRQAVEDFSGGLGESRVLLTSRTYAYQNQAWRLPGFEEAVLAPFSRGQIDRFVGCWYEQMVTLGRFREEDAKGRAQLLRQAIFGSDRLMGLAERPLLLTLMASLHAWRGGSLPEQREELYADAVELLLNTWERQRLTVDRTGKPVQLQPSLAEWLRVDRQEVRQVLEELAFEAHGSQADLSGTADLEEGKLVSRFLHLSRNPGADAVQLLAYLRDRAGLLVERGMGVYTFPHRTFQEYLAACHLTGGIFPDEAARLGREDPGRWREVVLLAGAKAARGAVATVWHLAEALCFREPGAPEVGPEDNLGALLAGQVLLESGDPRRMSEANKMKLQQVRHWLVYLMRTDTFPVLERATAGRVLAGLGDPRFDPDLWYLPKEPLLGFVKVPAGPFQMGDDLHEVEVPTFYIARYPVTVAQFYVFVEASSYEPEDRSCLIGLANHPVLRVSRNDALAYCKWLGERLRERQADSGETENVWEALAAGDLHTCLPSGAEWEKAARGTDGRTYPWGEEADPNRANFAETGLWRSSAVGCFPTGASPYGCEEMSGNVLEWTPKNRQVDIHVPTLRYGVLRGGSWLSNAQSIRCIFSSSFPPDRSYFTIGFRVVLSPFCSDP